MFKLAYKSFIAGLVIGPVIYIFILQNSVDVNRKRDIRNRWEQGSIFPFNNAYLEVVFNHLADKLVEIKNDIKQTQKQAQPFPLVTPKNFDDQQKKNHKKNAVLADQNVNFAMGSTNRAADEDDNDKSEGNKLKRDKIAHESEKFVKGLQSLYDTVIEEISDSHGTDLDEYSSVLLRNYFAISDLDLIKDLSPNIQVFGVYITCSEMEMVGYYPSIKNLGDISLNQSLWYRTSLGSDRNKNSGKDKLYEEFPSKPDVGLTVLYSDSISGKLNRTLWYRFNDENFNYLVCIDLLMKSPTLLEGLFSNTTFSGKLRNTLISGLCVGILAAVLAPGFIILIKLLLVSLRSKVTEPATKNINEADSPDTASAHFHSCFLSYSSKDEQFAQKLHKDLSANGVQCWFAPRDIQGGRKIHEQIFTEIKSRDRLLLILSEHSIKSNWVSSEIAKAIEVQEREGRNVIFPIRLVTFDVLQSWSCFDGDIGKDSAQEIRKYYIPDFSEWKNKNKYNKALTALLNCLQKE